MNYVEKIIMDLLIILLNSPWSAIGIFNAILSLPKKIKFSKNPPAIIFYVRSFWWYRWLPSRSKVRGITNGHIISLTDEADQLDLKHELIHVEQGMRYPFISGPLFLYEQILHWSDPMSNRFEKEAYERSGSRFLARSGK